MLVLLFFSQSTGSAAFIGFSWTCLLVLRAFSATEKREGPIWKKLVSESIGLFLWILFYHHLNWFTFYFLFCFVFLHCHLLGGGSEPSCGGSGWWS